jgi:transcriptional regulator with XRE-family HTH domain
MPGRRNQKIQSEIGMRIRAARERAGLTQEQVASRLGTAANVLSRIETGQRGLSIPQLVDLAAALGVSPGALFENRSNPRTRNAKAVEESAAGETELLRAWRSLDDDSRATAVTLMTTAAAEAKRARRSKR